MFPRWVRLSSLVTVSERASGGARHFVTGMFRKQQLGMTCLYTICFAIRDGDDMIEKSIHFTFDFPAKRAQKRLLSTALRRKARTAARFIIFRWRINYGYRRESPAVSG